MVLHLAASGVSVLPRILSRAGPLPAEHPRDGEPIRPGRIYVAPPDHHLLVEKGGAGARGGRVAVKKGPKENRFRPSIDALFRSAAYTCRARAVGVVLSGALDDGTSGLWSIKRLGGVAIVQKPEDATVNSMPLSAIEHVKVDYELPAKEIGPLLTTLAAWRPRRAVRVSPALAARVHAETLIAARGEAYQHGVMGLGTPSPFTCPECHGALTRIREGAATRFRCHTGHAYTQSALLDGVMESTGDMLWQVIRSMEEASMVLRETAATLEKSGGGARAARYLAKAKEIEARSRTFHTDALSSESLSDNNMGRRVDGVGEE